MTVYGFDYSVIFLLLTTNATIPYVRNDTGGGEFNQNQNTYYTFNSTNLVNFGNPFFPPDNSTVFNSSST